jgi:hypothetical protein
MVIGADLTVGGDELVVAGFELRDDEGGRSGTWRTDAKGGDETELGPSSASRQLADVAILGRTVYAAGSVGGFPMLVRRDVRAEPDAPWTDTWRMAALEGVAGSGDLAAVAVSGDDHVVAAGTRRSPDGLRALLVTSLDDGTWRPSSWDGGAASATAAAFVGDEALAGGATFPDDRSSRAAVWSGDAGTSTWRPSDVPSPDGARRTSITALAGDPTGGRVVAVGDVDGAPGAWVRDGGTWSFAGSLPDATVPGRHVVAVAFAAGGDGTFLAVGQQTGIGDVQTPIAWSSTDGRTWRTVGVGGSDGTGLVDAFPDEQGRLVAVGNRVAGKRTTPVVYDLRGAVLLPRR